MSRLGALASAVIAFTGFFVLAIFMFVAGNLPMSILSQMKEIFGGVAVMQVFAVILGYACRAHGLGRMGMMLGFVILLVIGMFAYQGRII